MSEPLDGIIPSSLTTMANGDVSACGDIYGTGSSNPRACQIFNAKTQSWSKSTQLANGQDRVGATLLKSGSVFSLW